MISSRQHPLCKLVRKLGEVKHRRREVLFVVEGGNSVTAAIAARWPLSRLLAAPEDLDAGWRAVAEGAGAEAVAVDPDILAYLADAQTSPGVLALAEMPTPPQLGEVLPPDEDGLLLVLDGIADPGNVGTLIRTADAAGARGVILGRGCADPFGAKVVRASAGSVFHLPLLLESVSGPYTEDQVEFDTALIQSRVRIVTADAHDAADCFDFTWPRRCALVLGHETRGISERWADAASHSVTIPLRGRAESLGVASAGAILLFAAR